MVITSIILRVTWIEKVSFRPQSSREFRVSPINVISWLQGLPVVRTMRYIVYIFIPGLVHVLDQFSALCGFNQGSFNFSIQAFQQLSISSFARFFSNFLRYCGLQSFRRSSRKLFCFCTWVFFWSAICLEVRDCGNSHENREPLNYTLAIPVRVIRQQHSVF
jgi:hypothetical protein